MSKNKLVKNNNTKKMDTDLVITRVFSAPRERVWQVWTEPEYASLWWGPKDFIAPQINIDLRVGGKYLYCMQSPDGKKFWSTGTYIEIVPLERIVATDSFADEDGNIISAEEYGMSPDFPMEMQVTTEFADYAGGKTELTLRHMGIPVGEMIELTRQGWNESFDKLEKSLLR